MTNGQSVKFVSWPDLRSETGVGKSQEEEKALADSAPDQGAVRRSRPWNR